MRHKMMFWFLIVVTGCAVGPDYTKPESHLPAHWFSASIDDKAQIEQTWWKNFNDPILDQLIEKASTGNLDLKIAESSIEQARASRSAAKSSLFPSMDAQAGATRQANRFVFAGAPPEITKPFNSFQAGFDATWELDVFGAKRRGLESANATLAAAHASRDNIRVRLLAEVARTYVEIRLYQAQLTIAQNMIKNYENNVRIAQERFDSGTTAKQDVTLAKAQWEQAQAQIPYYRNALAQAEFSMDTLLSEQPGATHALVQTPSPIPVSNKALVLAAPAAVIANRPDIQLAERQLASATADQGVAVAELFPQISLSGFVGLLNVDSNKLIQGSSKSWSAGGNVLLPILNYGKISADIDTADARKKEQLAQYQKSIIAALSDVERSVTAYTTQQEYSEKLATATSDQQHAEEISRQRYKEGLTSFFEVLDTERTLYTSQTQLAEARAHESENIIAVYKSLGGGWN